MSATIVLVHGAFVDGSGWRGVYDELKAGGSDVRIVQNPTKSLTDDAAITRDVLDTIDGPVVLVGHSYGGAVITEAGTHEKVASLVYVTAFAPDQGESVNALIATFPADGPQPPILPPVDGNLYLDRAKFHDSFAADVSPEEAAFMADSQVPWGLDALGGTVTEAAWRVKPSWYLHVTEDRMIPPGAQTSMAERMGATVAETPGSHAIYVSQPKVVAGLIRRAAASIAAEPV
ncbi:alpha/beta fold hydrolase [Prescottella agglutinans]|uniref:Pimeloyl-ACP methyl ester carboxylesterase n=1 Tax=Prescottella agglutinans TaxID=1644129 RepID=A0ABT6M953_9NOCA|nr:alpha/beta hydrolase [Prescottella agglutinans]MDH6279939.1 pimeloyl-ACP methyl ester carboxylesterase [Prescottella agglutinans]